MTINFSCSKRDLDKISKHSNSDKLKKIVKGIKHLGENDIAQKLNKAIISSLTTRNVLTPDLGGNASTSQVTDEIMSLMD